MPPPFSAASGGGPWKYDPSAIQAAWEAWRGIGAWHTPLASPSPSDAGDSNGMGDVSADTQAEHCSQLNVESGSGDVGGYGYNVDPKEWERIFPGALGNITDARSHSTTPVGSHLGDARTLHGLTNTHHFLTRLDGGVYLDYAGAGVYTDAQIHAFTRQLLNSLYGNAHSRNPSSERTSLAVSRVRSEVLRFMNADPSEYAVVFTRGATEALRIVAESFPWTKGSDFVYLRANHNSVLGIREAASEAGGGFHVVDTEELERRMRDTCDAADPPIRGDNVGCAAAKNTSNGDLIDIDNNDDEEDEEDDDDDDEDGAGMDPSVLTAGDREDPSLVHPRDGLPYHMFAYPGEDNFAGVVYPLEWIERVRRGLEGHKPGRWLVLLDAAALMPTRRLDLSKYKPDFVSMSFYKMFGFPTGLGALVVRKRVAKLMHKRYFGGGTISFVSPEEHLHLDKLDASTRFEDGTVNFLDIVASRKGFEMLSALGIDNITKHVDAVTKYAYQRLSSMRHTNGARLAEIYGAHDIAWNKTKTTTGAAAAAAAANSGTGDAARRKLRQGPVLTFNLLHADGSVIGYASVEKKASLAGFHIRTGCLCNPGACFGSIGLNLTEVRDVLMSKHSCGDTRDAFGGRPLGAIRTSFGYLTTFADIERWMLFLEQTFLE